ncbi:MAG: nuclease, partial [Actinomycetota bacterium]|nr:nuclease [Actinomycetota bacterium]
PAPVEPPAEPASAETVAENVVVGRTEPPPVEPWVDPDVAGLCPSSHPVKAKLASGIYHLPGMAAYARTRADRCYCDEETAQTDGLRKAKR